MRDAFTNGMLSISEQNDKTVFMTGDLGFNALEPLQATLGDRFVNCGIAEQNMVSMAAGLAHRGLSPWVYSIAPFVYARPYEQIRNDVGLHRLPVKLVGNGGGYGYGVMGATHHAIEDYGAMLTVQNMRVYVPAFDLDILPILQRMDFDTNPSYLRLGREEAPAPMLYAPWRQLVHARSYNPQATIVAVGPLAGALMKELTAGDGPYVSNHLDQSTRRKTLWCVSEMPIVNFNPPAEFLNQVRGNELIVVEEHVVQGGFGQQLLYALASNGVEIADFYHYCAQGYTSGRYGSQQFHRAESGIDVEEICRA